MDRDPVFATEVELCRAFIAELPTEWTAFPETAGWDILLVRDDGVQIGIQAKLKLNAKVINQSVEGWYDVCRPGPDYRAILVPSVVNQELAGISAYVGLTVVTMKHPASRFVWAKNMIEPVLPDKADRPTYGSDRWFPMFPTKREVVPDYVPDVAAGASAPLQLTKWKIAAIKITIILEARGFVTREDFKAISIDHRRWITGWLAKDPEGRGWVATQYTPDFKLQHPVNFEQIRADSVKWMPVPMLPQPELL